MFSAGTQDASNRHEPGSPHGVPGSGLRRRLAWAALVFWVAYSGAVLSWHALTLPPAAACIVR